MARSLKNILLGSFTTMVLVAVIACFGQVATITFQNDSAIFEKSEIATLSEEEFAGGTLEAEKIFYHNSEILMPNEIAVPTLERNNISGSSNSADQNYGKHTTSYLHASIIYTGVRLKERFIQENRQKSHLKLIGYYIYQLRRIII